MKWYAALIEPSEFDWSEAKLSRYRRNSCAGVGVIARYEHEHRENARAESVDAPFTL
jgi:hypothetical protein